MRWPRGSLRNGTVVKAPAQLVVVRRGRWKLVREHPSAWEIYDLANDRSELVNVAAQHPALAAELAAAWQAWADRVGVIPWETVVDAYRAKGKTAEEAAG